MVLTDLDVTALTIWGEARNQHAEGRIAVASVIRNRLALGHWGSTWTEVCRAPFQFSCWNAGPDKNHAALIALAAQISGGGASADVDLRECYWIAQGAQSGAMQDRVSGATHYHTADLWPLPAWARGHDPVAHVGDHVFYKGIA